MKTFQRFNEDAKSINAFMKDTFMNNPTIKSITGDLKSGNININKIKDTVTSDKGKKDLNNLKKTGLNTLINIGRKKLLDFEDKVNK
tara:strand:+ start:233 stop:493 length:261 start_codon:yes stop_codon:yes gene_type:complete